VETHIVNITSQQAAGHIVQIFVEEHDQVTKGQLLAQLDPVPYQEQVALLEARLQVARAQLAQEQAALDTLRAEVPRQVAMAQKALDAAAAAEARALKTLYLTEQDVDKGIAEATAVKQAAEAVLVNATEDYNRFGKLAREQSVAVRQYEEATRAYKTAQADLGVAAAKLARAEAARIRIDIERKNHEEAQHLAQKATEALALAKLGDLRITELERLVAVKGQQIKEAQSALAVARTNLAYTRIVAPFDGIVVKRYRHLGDYAPVGTPILSMFNPELVYVTAQLE
jgi:membrane fusion protein (multidrug efflux system)